MTAYWFYGCISSPIKPSRRTLDLIELGDRVRHYLEREAAK
jgi:hypothetical protein